MIRRAVGWGGEAVASEHTGRRSRGSRRYVTGEAEESSRRDHGAHGEGKGPERREWPQKAQRAQEGRSVCTLRASCGHSPLCSRRSLWLMSGSWIDAGRGGVTAPAIRAGSGGSRAALVPSASRWGDAGFDIGLALRAADEKCQREHERKELGFHDAS